MSFIFEIVDKTKRNIYLSKERWNHITSPSSPHSYMANYLEEIKKTLSNPDKIINSIYDVNRGFIINITKIENNFLEL